MKITGLGLLAIITLAASVSADSSFVGAVDTDIARGGVLGDGVKDYIPVSIDVHCKGVDWKSLTAKEDEASAEILMQAYNIVHQQLDGDKYLAKVHFEGFTMDAEEEEDEDDADEDDDEALEVERRRRKPPPKKNSAHYNGGAGCHFCNPDDDDAAAATFLDLGGTGSKSLVPWEKKFEEMLKQGPHSALHGANKCDIALWPMQDAAAADEDSGDQQNLRGSNIMNDAHSDDKKGGTTAEYY